MNTTAHNATVHNSTVPNITATGVTAQYQTSQVALYQQANNHIGSASTIDKLTAAENNTSWSFIKSPDYSKTFGALQAQVNKVKKWRYLLSDSLTFSKQSHAIRIQKPQQSLMMDYCKKLLCAAQLQELFIENHEFTQAQKEELISLAKRNHVSIILLSVESGYHRNVLSGPWLQ